MWLMFNFRCRSTLTVSNTKHRRFFDLKFKVLKMSF